MSVIGMLTHGHGHNAYVHFALRFWPSDPNFTIGSLSKCFQNLERLDNHMYGDLMQMHTPSTVSNQVLDSLMSPHALERHMAIKAEKSSSCMLKMGTCQGSSGNACSVGSEGSMPNNIILENVCLERSEENAFNIFNTCRNDA